MKTASAESAIHSGTICVGLTVNRCVESRFQRWSHHPTRILGRCPRLLWERAFSAKQIPCFCTSKTFSCAKK
jgi:hypothetical protein